MPVQSEAELNAASKDIKDDPCRIKAKCATLMTN